MMRSTYYFGWKKSAILLIFGAILLLCKDVWFLRYAMGSINYSVLKAHTILTFPLLKIKALGDAVICFQKDVRQLIDKNADLTQQVIDLHSRLAFIHETEELREFCTRYTQYHKILSQVMLCQNGNKSHFFLMDAGEKQGVEQNMIAIYKNCIVGRVTQVFPYYCKVALITDASCQISVVCAKTKTHGIYHGTYQKNLASLEHVKHYDQLEHEDLLLTSGQGLIYPRGFGVAKVKDFSVEGLNYTVSVEPLVDVNSISYCYLIARGQDVR